MGKDKIERISLLGDVDNGPINVLERRIESIMAYHTDFISMITSLMFADVFVRSTMQVDIPIKGKLTNIKKYMEEGSNGIDYNEMKLFLRKQVTNDLPYLTTNGIVKLFSYLEETIRSLIISIFKIEGNIEKIPIFEKVKLNIHDYLKYEPEEFYELLYSKYQEQIPAFGKNEREESYSGYGIERFERQLQPLGLSGKIEKKDKENIYELIQLRHCIAHRDSIVDSKLLRKCPQLNFKIGDEVAISIDRFNEYHVSLKNYLSLIISRVKNHIKGID